MCEKGGACSPRRRGLLPKPDREKRSDLDIAKAFPIGSVYRRSCDAHLQRKRKISMSSLMTPLAYLGGAIFLSAFIWKSYDFFKEAWSDAKANQFPPRKCLQVALAHTALLWLLVLGSFAVLGITTLKADSLLIGLIVMAVWVVGLIVLLMKLGNTMPVKAKDHKDRQQR